MQPFILLRAVNLHVLILKIDQNVGFSQIQSHIPIHAHDSLSIYICNLFIHSHTHVRTYLHVHVHVFFDEVHVYTCMYVYMYMYVHVTHDSSSIVICSFIPSHTCIYIHTDSFIHSLTYVVICTCICLHPHHLFNSIYVHTCTCM